MLLVLSPQSENSHVPHNCKLSKNQDHDLSQHKWTEDQSLILHQEEMRLYLCLQQKHICNMHGVISIETTNLVVL